MKQLQDQTVYEGDVAHFECTISKFWPQHVITWLFQGKPIENSQYYKMSEKTGDNVLALEVYETHVDDAGAFVYVVCTLYVLCARLCALWP